MSLELRPLGQLSIVISSNIKLEGLPANARVVGEATSCELVGEQVRASQGGTCTDWLTLHADGSVSVDARLLLATPSGHHLALTYRGRARALPITGAAVYITPRFETDDPDLTWLNQVQGVGKGLRHGPQLEYELYELV